MKRRMEGSNGRIAVDAAHRIVVAHWLATNPADQGALSPLVEAAPVRRKS